MNELHATEQSTERYLEDIEKNVPKKKEQLKSCKELIAKLDTAYRDKQANEERFNKIEESQKELAEKLDKIIAALNKK